MITNREMLFPWSDESRFSLSHGLWRSDAPGHTLSVSKESSVHSGPEAACRLVALSDVGDVEKFLTPVLEGLLGLQEREATSDFFGCFRWYFEESHIADTNAAFFIGLNLIVLQQGYSGRLDSRNRDCLRHMFEAMDVWFDRQVRHASGFYPNKFLGDLVCSWLLKEILDRKPDSTLLSVMGESGAYWRTSPWGWGEHLSDLYAAIMLNELSSLLLIARRLPEGLRRLYTELLRDLLAIEDAYAQGPRVPAIRTYAFTYPTPSSPFRSFVRPAEDWNATLQNAKGVPHLRMFSFGSFFHRHGWHDLAGSVSAAKNKITIACYGGVEATAQVENDFRIGSLSRFPVMPHTDHQQWGLSWQSMPVAFCGEKRNWGFLRWHARERDIDRYHPAWEKRHAYLHNALTDSTNPPIVGQTRSRQEAMRVVILREMRSIAGAWQKLGDGWDIVEFSGKVMQEIVCLGGWSRLHLQLEGGRDLALFHFSLNVQCAPALTQSGNNLSWRVTASQESLKVQSRFCQIWLVGESGDPDPILQQVPTLQTYPLWEKRKLCWAAFPNGIEFIFGDYGWEVS